MVDIDLLKCKGCGACVKDCFSRNLYVIDEKAAVKSDECIRCGHCVAICPENAVCITEYDMEDVHEVTEQGISPDALVAFIKNRRSIRQYKDKCVETELIKQIIEAGRYTPTASNRQEITFIVVEKEMEMFRALVIESLGALGREFLESDDASPLLKNYAQRWISIERAYKTNPAKKDYVFLGAPVVILIAGDHPVDAGLAASNMELVACANGLGVLYSGFITRGSKGEKVRNAVGIPPGKEVLTVLLIGYPDVKYQRNAPRKKADTVWV